MVEAQRLGQAAARRGSRAGVAADEVRQTSTGKHQDNLIGDMEIEIVDSVVERRWSFT